MSDTKNPVVHQGDFMAEDSGLPDELSPGEYRAAQETVARVLNEMSDHLVQGYLDLLDRADPLNNNQFSSMVRFGVQTGFFTPRELGQAVGVSAVHVGRWLNGYGFPGPASRLTVMERMKELSKR